METKDYLQLPKDTEHYWYNVLEQTLRREVKEEVGIEIEHIEYDELMMTEKRRKGNKSEWKRQ